MRKKARDVSPVTPMPSGVRTRVSTLKSSLREQEEGQETPSLSLKRRTSAPSATGSKKPRMSKVSEGPSVIAQPDDESEDGAIPGDVFDDDSEDGDFEDEDSDSDSDGGVEIPVDDEDQDVPDFLDAAEEELNDVPSEIPEGAIFYAVATQDSQEEYTSADSSESLTINEMSNLSSHFEVDFDFAARAYSVVLNAFRFKINKNIVSQIQNFLRERPDRQTLDSFALSWPQEELRFIQAEAEMSGCRRDIVCQSSGNPSAPVAFQLNHPTLELTGRLPGRTLDPKVKTTRFLIEGGIDLSNSFTFDTYPHRYPVRYIIKNGKAVRAATWPETLELKHQAVNFEHVFKFWRTSPAKVVVLCGAENRVRFTKDFAKRRPNTKHELVLGSTQEFGGGFQIGLYLFEGTIKKVVVFMHHPEWLCHAGQAGRMEWTRGVHFAYQLAGVRLPECGFGAVRKMPITKEIKDHCHTRIESSEGSNTPLVRKALPAPMHMKAGLKTQTRPPAQQSVLEMFWEQATGSSVKSTEQNTLIKKGKVQLVRVESGRFAEQAAVANVELAEIQDVLGSQSLRRWAAKAFGLTVAQYQRLHDYLRCQLVIQEERGEPIPYAFMNRTLLKFFLKHPKCIKHVNPATAYLEDVVNSLCMKAIDMTTLTEYGSKTLGPNYTGRKAMRYTLAHAMLRIPLPGEPKKVEIKCQNCESTKTVTAIYYKTDSAVVTFMSVCYKCPIAAKRVPHQRWTLGDGVGKRHMKMNRVQQLADWAMTQAVKENPEFDWNDFGNLQVLMNIHNNRESYAGVGPNKKKPNALLTSGEELKAIAAEMLQILTNAPSCFWRDATGNEPDTLEFVCTMPKSKDSTELCGTRRRFQTQWLTEAFVRCVELNTRVIAMKKSASTQSGNISAGALVIPRTMCPKCKQRLHKWRPTDPHWSSREMFVMGNIVSNAKNWNRTAKKAYETGESGQSHHTSEIAQKAAATRRKNAEARAASNADAAASKSVKPATLASTLTKKVDRSSNSTAQASKPDKQAAALAAEAAPKPTTRSNSDWVCEGCQHLNTGFSSSCIMCGHINKGY